MKPERPLPRHAGAPGGVLAGRPAHGPRRGPGKTRASERRQRPLPARPQPLCSTRARSGGQQVGRGPGRLCFGAVCSDALRGPGTGGRAVLEPWPGTAAAHLGRKVHRQAGGQRPGPVLAVTLHGGLFTRGHRRPRPPAGTPAARRDLQTGPGGAGNRVVLRSRRLLPGACSSARGCGITQNNRTGSRARSEGEGNAAGVPWEVVGRGADTAPLPVRPQIPNSFPGRETWNVTETL